MVYTLRCQTIAYMVSKLSVYIYRKLSIYLYKNIQTYSQKRDIQHVRAHSATVQYGAEIKIRPLKRAAITKSKILTLLIIAHAVSVTRVPYHTSVFKTEFRTSRTSAKRLLSTGFQPTKWPPSNSGAPVTRPAGPGLPSGGDAADYDGGKSPKLYCNPPVFSVGVVAEGVWGADFCFPGFLVVGMWANCALSCAYRLHNRMTMLIHGGLHSGRV